MKNERQSGKYLLVIDKLPIVGYAIQTMLDNLDANIKVVQFSDWPFLVTKTSLLESIEVVGIVADMIETHDLNIIQNRIFVLEVLFIDCPILIFSFSMHNDFLEQLSPSIKAYIYKLDSPKELNQALASMVLKQFPPKILLSSGIRRLRKITQKPSDNSFS